MVRLLQAASNPALIADPSREFTLPPDNSLDAPLLGLIQNYSRYEVPPKLLTSVELVRRLAGQGERVIVWTHFIQNIEILLQYLQEFGALPLYGDVPRDDADDEDYNRERHIRRFRDQGDTCRVLVANPGAAAESISLHRICHHAVYVDRTFNAGQFMQSRDRIHRVGLTPDEIVTYHLLVTQGTIDQTVHDRLLAKEGRMLALLDDPNIPVVDLPVSTDQLSGTEDEEELDFAAVIEHLRAVTHR
jgi:SNF2 family DNA or RNA helicase